ncbi:MAG: fused response regulator/phosphatase [Gemmataceae bacterium]
MRILIAEDDPISRRLLERTLQQWGYEVTAAADGREAWRLFQERDYPIVISDWVMPEMDGLELVRRIRSGPRPGYVYVILLAAATHRREVVEGLAAGADDFVSKPFDRDELRVRLRAGERILGLEQALVERNRALTERNAEMEQDLRMACEVQQALLPQGYPSFPANAPPEQSALRFCDRYRPNGAVGGDFFDVMALSDTRAGLFICDVMGHGVRAALVTAMVRALLESLRPLAENPGQLLAEMNRDLLGIFSQSTVPVFLSACYAIIDTVGHRMIFANAGHPAPLLIDRSAREVTFLNPPGGMPGPPMGVSEQASYGVGTVPLGVGDVVLFFTDGLFEVVGADQEPFGEEQLRRAVVDRIDFPAGRMCDDLLSEVIRYSGGRGFADDVCLVGMEFLGAGSDLAG